MSDSKETSIKYDVCFVHQGSDPDKACENLKLAFGAMESNQLDPIWLPEEKCFKFEEKEAKLFVMDPFEGKVFEHLKSIKCRIVGPLSILYCLQYGDVLPKRPHPVYSVSMRKITVSCSNIDNVQRENIFQKVELMGGFFSKDFTKSVTHLVVGEVGSKKYQVAANFGLPIMMPSWVDDVWSNGQHKQIHGSDRCYNKYKCPVFKGLVITVSQLSTDERSAIQAIVESNGGTYLPPLKAHETTHLVLAEPSGDKYRYAKSWKVFCVNVNWIYESVKAGYCKDENLFKIENSSKGDQPKRSTPNRDLTLELPPVDCSVINNVSVISHLDETLKSDISLPVIKTISSKFSDLETFDLSSLPKYGQFLDGCKIFLTGFTTVHLDKLRRIINAGGGMRFNKYSDIVTHVVCNELKDDLHKMIKSSSTQPFIISTDWLLSCCKEQQMVDEVPFLIIDTTMLSPDKNEPDIRKLSLSSSSQLSAASQLKIEAPAAVNITEIFDQYIPGKSSNEAELNNSDKGNVQKSKDSNCAPRNNNTNSSAKSSTNNVEEIIDLADEEPSQDTCELFSGLKFLISGFGEKDADILTRLIESHSGMILASDSVCIADIAIVPIIKHNYELHASNIITNCWLQKCIEDSRIYDFSENELFMPVSVQLEKKPFTSFVISVSQYSGTERDCLMHLAEVMGATCQEYFVRKANKSRGIMSNTHLIASTPEGNKYAAAKKWKIPAVTKQWILDTAKLGSAPPVDDYLIDNLFRNSKTDIDVNSANTSKNKSSTDKSLSHSHTPVQKQKLQQETDKSLSGPSTSKALPKFSTEIKMISKPFEKTMSPIVTKPLNKLMTPLISKIDNSMNESCESLDLNKSYKHKFRISGLLNELDSSATHDLSSSMRKHSLPIEDLFGKNLASAVKGINCTLNSESDFSHLDCEQNLKEDNQNIKNSAPLKGVVIYVSKKLNNLQQELNELVLSLGGDYLWTFDNVCTHFIFAGKQNDLSRDFREARGQGKKIVCPEWLYACKEQNGHLDEELYPHTLKSNMSLANEISVVKSSTAKNNTEKENITVDIKDHNKSSGDGTAVDFNKQLNELLVAAKSAKKRYSRRLVNSVSSSPSNEIVSKIQRTVSDSFIKPLQVEENATGDEPGTGSQFSQPYPIVWDDPTGRLEREKIAAKSATLNAQSNSANQEISSNRNSECVSKSNSKIQTADIEETDIIKKDCLQLEKSDTTHRDEIKKFMFTNIPDPKKNKLISIINELGGSVSDERSFDITATHLILEKPLKNEKLLSSVASGKWVLHPTYLIASEEHKMFLPEETFEWGGPSTSEFAQNLPPASRKIASCSFRWRKKLKDNTNEKGAFYDWKVIVIAEDKGKQLTYIKILEAGGAEIVPSESPASALDNVSHAIIDMKKRSLSQLDLSPYISHNVKCVKPEYLAFYLIEDPSPDIENFIIPEAKELMGTSLPSSKRRNLSVTTRGSKRSKVS